MLPAVSNVANQLARRAAYFNLLCHAYEADAKLLKVGHDPHQVRQATSELIQPLATKLSPARSALRHCSSTGHAALFPTASSYRSRRTQLLDRVTLQV